MLRSSPTPQRLLLTVTALAVTLAAAAQSGPSSDELRKLENAGPARCTVTPKQPRRLLVFTRCRGYYHTSIPYGSKLIENMGSQTKAFQTVVSNDPSVFEPDSLARFDAICLMSALGEFLLPDDFEKLPADRQQSLRAQDLRLKQGFYAWLKSGKGLAAIHGGCYSFHDTPEFAELFGAAFDRHPWNSHEKIAIRLDDPAHPLNAAFGGCGLEILDEGYQFKTPYDRHQLRVLYSLDTARVDLNKPDLRPDRDFALGWVKTYGQGRIFYSALGHNSEEFWNPTLARHWLDGLQFALGDLPAPTTPLP